ncbi:MAG: restriction endonuclease subunit S [Bryobacteraceae bacterium]
MSPDWHSIKIGDLDKIVTGKTPPSARPECFGNDYPFITPSDIGSDTRRVKAERHLSMVGKESMPNHLLPERAICVVCIGATIGKICMTHTPSFTNQQINSIIVDRTRFDPHFVYYAMRKIGWSLLGLASGAATPIINKSSFSDVEIVAPALPTQRRIASILSAYDDLIENNTRRIAILEEMAWRLYEEWFVRFRFPGHEQVKMVDSELGLIPEGWFPSPVGECVTVHRGKSYKSAELADEGGRPFVNLKCMERDGGFRKSGLKRFTGSYKETQKVTTGDLVMAVTDMTQERRIVARCGRVPRLGADFGVISMDLVKIDANKGVPKDFMYGMFRWSGFADEVKQHANGANVLHLSPDRIAEYRFALPPSDFTAQFAGLISPMLHQSDVLLEKNEVLRATRDLLLPKLISGELDVSTLSGREEAAAA